MFSFDKASAEYGKSLGLKNVHSRLALLFGEPYGLHFWQTRTGNHSKTAVSQNQQQEGDYVVRILIVDDDALIRKWLEMLLMQIPGREVIVEKAENGLLALQQIRRGPLPDLLITDVKMPQMDGLALCRHVKAVKSGSMQWKLTGSC